MTTETADPRTGTAIGKVAAVVEALASERRIADIARITGLAGSTVHRILRELVDLGWARDDGERGYLLGARLLSLVGQASNRNTLSRIGLAIPLHCTAIGKAILSAMSDEELRATLDRTGTESRTEHTITDRAALTEHLAEVRRRGYSVDDEENELHTRCIGTAVIDHRGLPLGGISLSALAFDLDRDRVERLAPLVVGAGTAVSQAIGGLDTGR